MPYTSCIWRELPVFPLPSSIIKEHLVLKPRAVSLLMALCHLNKMSNPDGEFSVETSQDVLSQRTGLSRVTLNQAIKELEEKILITCDKKKFDITRYSMVDPSTAEVLSTAQRSKSLYYANGIKYLTVPCLLVTKPDNRWSLAQMSSSEVALYTAVMWLANKTRSNNLPFNREQIIERSGIVDNRDRKSVV